MFGYASPKGNFINKSKAPEELTPAELKEECLARARVSKHIHPHFLGLAERCVAASAYLHSVKKCEVLKPWDSPSVTLIGDAVFNMTTTLGKGANCALLDAFSLAETLSFGTKSVLSYSLRYELPKFAADNISRRLRERQRSAFVQNIMFFGRNRIERYCREKVLKAALGWIEDAPSKDTPSGTTKVKHEHRPGTARSGESGDSGDSSLLSGANSFLERELGLMRIEAASALDGRSVHSSTTSGTTLSRGS